MMRRDFESLWDNDREESRARWVDEPVSDEPTEAEVLADAYYLGEI